MYDYSKLKGRIVEVCGTQTAFAKELGITKGTLSEKMRNKKAFKQSEIYKAKEILKLDDITPYFFNK